MILISFQECDKSISKRAHSSSFFGGWAPNSCRHGSEMTNSRPANLEQPWTLHELPKRSSACSQTVLRGGSGCTRAARPSSVNCARLSRLFCVLALAVCGTAAGARTLLPGAAQMSANLICGRTLVNEREQSSFLFGQPLALLIDHLSFARPT